MYVYIYVYVYICVYVYIYFFLATMPVAPTGIGNMTHTMSVNEYTARMQHQIRAVCRTK